MRLRGRRFLVFGDVFGHGRQKNKVGSPSFFRFKASGVRQGVNKATSQNPVC